MDRNTILECIEGILLKEKKEEILKQVDMFNFRIKLETELDLIGTLFQNGWLDNDGVRGSCDYASIEINDFIQYLQKADWFKDKKDLQKLLDLIQEAM
tara:strand:+ start:339 stop:632 length:294 start_codon:yes stop_codon:yes gene_type:complete